MIGRVPTGSIMLSRLLQGIGAIAVLALVAGSLIALTLVSQRIHVTVQDEQEGAARGPDPIELLRADVTQLSADLGALTDGMGGQLSELHAALEDGARARADAQAAEVAALRRQVQELQARLDRAVVEDAAARARIDQALCSIGARLDAVVAAGASTEPVVDVPLAMEPPGATEKAPVAEAEPAAAPPSTEPAAAEAPKEATKGFLTFKLPSRAFAFDRLQRWSILPNLSRVGFDAKSTLHDFSGSTQRVEGELVANLARPEVGCKGKVTVDATALDSGEAARDEDMRASLDVRGHPELTFEWTGFETGSSDATAMKTSGKVLGKLTIRGTSRELAMPVRISVDASKRVAVEGEVEIRMSDFGVAPPRKLGVLTVEDGVKIWIALRARSLGDAVAERDEGSREDE
jgi:polyisoprenoid-binding protein YceI